MAYILVMPRQGNTVESCIITNWAVKEGDLVAADTIVCEVETDKAAFEVPAGAAGTVLKFLYESGDDVPVLQPIAVIGETSEDWKAAIKGEQGIGNRDQESGIGEWGIGNRGCDSNYEITSGICPDNSDRNPQSLVPSPQSPISPRARNLAAKEALPLPMSGTGPGGRIIERDVALALQSRPPLTAAAKALGARSVAQQGSGIGGRVTAADISTRVDPVDANISSQSLVPSLRSPVPIQYTETPIKGVRKIIADRMLKSLAESAQLTLNASTPVAKLQEVRSTLKAQGITINDLVLFALSRTLKQFQYMNAHKVGEVIKTFEHVHLGVAVDTERGLMVPVIRNADMLSLMQISQEVKRLAAACQSASIIPDELSGSTFTVTNLGSLGITSFTPVLNLPEVAILGVCGIELKCRATEGGFCFEPHIGFSLTINHQVVDGAPAARFLKALGEAVAQIDLLLKEKM